jgi:hypothetical protein
MSFKDLQATPSSYDLEQLKLSVKEPMLEFTAADNLREERRKKRLTKEKDPFYQNSKEEDLPW